MRFPIRALPFIIVFLAYLAGMFVDVFEIDAAQYATMARDMADSGDFLHLYDRGADYLDKPPLIFWLSALSFKLFGVGTFSYKLPSLLFALLALWSTYRLTRLLYNERTAYMATLILATTQAFFVMNNDVKTDMYLIGSMTFAIWQLAWYVRGGKWWNMQLGFVGIGLGMLAKGPIGLVAPAMALGIDFLLRRDWKGLFRWQWLLGLPTLALILLPFCIGLHQQFGWRGVEFFLWTQSFGRITGASEWANDATVFFFTHTYAWSFLPWTILSLFALCRRSIAIFKNGFVVPKNAEALSVGGFVLLFVALSFSRFKLPHYIFLTYPLAAMMTAAYLDDLLEDGTRLRYLRNFFRVHLGLLLLAFLVVAALCLWAFPVLWPLSLLVILLLLGLSGYLAFSRGRQWFPKLVLTLALGFAGCNLVLNTFSYQQLDQYQTSGVAGKYVRENDIPLDRLFAYGRAGRAMDFYSGRVMRMLRSPILLLDSAKAAPLYLFTTDEGLQALEKENIPYRTLQEFDHYSVARLSLPFINPATRDRVTSKRHLIHTSPK